MEEALVKLYSGDYNILPYIQLSIEGADQAPSGERGRELYAFLGSILVRVGQDRIARVLEARDDTQLRVQLDALDGDVPPASCWTSLCILATVAPRLTPDGLACRAALLSLGIQNCRHMLLDMYFVENHERDNLVTFLCVLMRLFGCTAAFLLHWPHNIAYMETSAVPPLNVRVLFRHNPRQEMALTIVVNSTRGGGSASRPPVGGRPMMQEPFPPHLQARVATIPTRSSLFVPIIGLSNDGATNPGRRYRALPKKPASTPYATNPLYDPNISAEENTLLAAQFPVPVAKFSALYGLGCEPRIPPSRSFLKHQKPTATRGREGEEEEVVASARLSAFFGSHPVRRSAPDGTTTVEEDTLAPLTTPAVLERSAEVQAAREEGLAASSTETRVAPPIAPATPLRSYPLSTADPVTAAERVTSDTGTPFAPRPMGSSASLLFAEVNDDPAVVALNARCVACPLLQQYLEQGRTLGWGDNSHFALGPLASGIQDPWQDFSPAPASPQAAVETGSFSPPPPPPQQPAMGYNNNDNGGATSAETGVGARRPSVPYPVCPSPKIVWNNEAIVDVACGMQATHLLTSSGELFSCGEAQWGQLGIGVAGPNRPKEFAHAFAKTHLSRNEEAVMVFAGSKTASAVTKEGHVYCWGANAWGQCLRHRNEAHVLTPIYFKTSKFKPTCLAFGPKSAGVLYDDGLVGTWGAVELLGRPAPPELVEPSLAAGDKMCVRTIVHLANVFDAPVMVLRSGLDYFLAISASGAVYTWGVGDEGQLGHGCEAYEETPRFVEGLRQHVAVEASCGAKHTAVVVATGRVFVFGQNDDGRLGVSGLRSRSTPTPLTLPTAAIAVSCGARCTCVLLQTGDVMTCGPGPFNGGGLGGGRTHIAPNYVLSNYVTLRLASGPVHSVACVLRRQTVLLRVGTSAVEELSRLDGLHSRSGVRDVAVGVGFLLILTENGKITAVGRGDKGQLGIGPAMRPAKPGQVTVVSSMVEVPKPPLPKPSKWSPAFEPPVWAAVACGPDYVFALDERGRVFGWGNNSHGLLLVPPIKATVFEPTLVLAYRDHDIVQIACGADFVAVLTRGGEVLTHGQYMYCGLSSPIEAPTRAANKGGSVRVLTPSEVRGLRQVVAIAAGKYHTVALTAASVVYAWGWGILGQGSSERTVAYFPVKVALSHNVRKLGCGPESSFAISDAGDLFVWGSNEYSQCGVAASSSSSSSSTAPLATSEVVTPAAAATTTATEDAGTARRGRSAPVPLAGRSEPAEAVVAVPTRVARRVRDAAFTSRFGFVLFEDGTVRASGSLRHGGRHYHLTSFDDNPQPTFSVDVNSVRSSSRGHGDRTNGAVEGEGGRQLATGETFFTPSRNPSPSVSTTPQRASNAPTSSPTEATLVAPPGGSNAGGRHPAAARASALLASSRGGGGLMRGGGGGDDGEGEGDGVSGSGAEQRRLSAGLHETNNSAVDPLVAAANHASARNRRHGDGGGGDGGTEDGTSGLSATLVPTPPPSSSQTAHSSAASPPPLVQAPPPSPLTGLCCFGGWDQVFFLAEKHRPSSTQVRHAHRGMQVYLRHKEMHEDYAA